MKKSRILGYALTLAATLFVGSAMGQDVAGGTNYVEIKAATSDAESYIQIDKDYGYFAKPDANFHPGYITPNWILTKDFSWTWSCTSTNAATIALVKGNATATGLVADYANFVAVKATAKGLYDIKVIETAPAAFGGCSDAGQTFKIFAFDKPSFSITTATNATTPNCGDLTDFEFKTSITSSGTPYVKYGIERYSVTINPTTGTKTVGAKIDDFVASSLVTFNPATGWDYDVTAATAAKTSGDATLTVKTALIPATQTLSTYELAHKKTLTQPTALQSPVIIYRLTVEGVNGLISRKADYTQNAGKAPLTVADYTLYGPSSSIDIYVARSPKTGPVYHIGNNTAK
jgi:hypothetical protein